MTGEQHSEFSGLSDAVLPSPAKGSVPQWIAVVSIVIGCLGILCWGGQGLMSMSVSSMVDMPDNLPEQSAGHRAFETGGYVAGTLLGVWLIAAGFAAATGAAWGRAGLRIWAVVRVVVAIVGVLGAIYWFDEVVDAFYQAMQADIARGGEAAESTPALSEAAVRAFMIGAIAVTTVAACVWPILVLVVTRRRGGA